MFCTCIHHDSRFDKFNLGLGLFYSGLSKSSNALHLILVCMLSMAVVTFQWFLFGFSLSFSETGSSFIGNFNFAFMMNVGNYSLSLVAPGVPAIVFALYQLQFAAITPAIIFGSVAGRIRLLPSLVFIFLWTTFVYDFVAYWTWGARGWLKNMSCLATVNLGSTPCAIGALDFAVYLF